jgi:maleate isomerase
MLDEHLPTAIKDLATARPDVVVFGCTSAGALRGNEYEGELVKSIAEQTSAEAISVAASVRRAIAARGARRVGVITPYVEALNVPIQASLEDVGIDENFAIASVEPGSIVAQAVEQFGGAEIDLLFASCTNFRALDARDEIERELGVPVLTSNQAALEAIADRLSVLSAGSA